MSYDHAQLMDPLEQIRFEYQESTAYHEAAHEIACIVQGIYIRELGLRIDSKGNGISHTYRRNPNDLNNTPKDIQEREQSIVLLFAGYFGQVRIHPETPYEAIAKDYKIIGELLDEMYQPGSKEWQAAWERLREQSEKLVAENWPVIDALAKAVWAKEWQPQQQLPEVDRGWSDDTVEKSMDAKEVESLVTPFRLNPHIRPDSEGSYSLPDGERISEK